MQEKRYLAKNRNIRSASENKDFWFDNNINTTVKRGYELHCVVRILFLIFMTRPTNRSTWTFPRLSV